MATSVPDQAQVVQFARDLVNRAIKSSLEQVRGPVAWPLGEDFTAEAGRIAIEQLVASWRVGGSWRNCLDYIGLRDGLHCYRVLWSRPSRRNPVARASAAVYVFIMTTDKASPVTALYVVEGQTLVHRPTESLKELWLNNVIENKLACMEFSL